MFHLFLLLLQLVANRKCRLQDSEQKKECSETERGMGVEGFGLDRGGGSVQMWAAFNCTLGGDGVLSAEISCHIFHLS